MPFVTHGLGFRPQVRLLNLIFGDLLKVFHPGLQPCWNWLQRWLKKRFFPVFFIFLAHIRISLSYPCISSYSHHGSLTIRTLGHLEHFNVLSPYHSAHLRHCDHSPTFTSSPTMNSEKKTSGRDLPTASHSFPPSCHLWSWWHHLPQTAWPAPPSTSALEGPRKLGSILRGPNLLRGQLW